MSKHPDPVVIEFGRNFPCPTTLRTGDVLFVRPPGKKPAPQPYTLKLASFQILLSPAQQNMKVAQYLGPALCMEVAMLSGRQDILHQELLEWPLYSTPSTVPTQEMQEMLFFLAILYTDMRDVVEEWFKMTVTEFLTTPLMRLLMKAFQGKLQDSFFIGHCAMVLREQDGISTDDTDAPLYVIEANSSSFTNYGVSLSRFHLAHDGAKPGELCRSWAAQRAAHGDVAWLSRHPALVANTPEAASMRNAILCRAKTYLGRSYSFFDNPTFADSGRLYCSEFIYRVFDDVRAGANGQLEWPQLEALDSDGVRTWQWMKTNNPPGANKDDLGHAIEDVWNHWRLGPIVKKLPFFILTVQMLWRTRRMQPLFKPAGEAYQ